tara:strand:- start:22 stop:468 length:447 start_codon:yes stop_codon:yes gene_type:complete
MKKLLGILFLGLLLSGNVYGQSMISLKKYANENKSDLEDPIVQTYILKRCGAAYLYAASITKSKDQATADSLIKAYDKVAVFAGRILMSTMNWTAETAAESLEKDMDNMLKFYDQDGSNSFARTGVYMMDNYIGDDLKYCKGIVEAIK